MRLAIWLISYAIAGCGFDVPAQTRSARKNVTGVYKNVEYGYAVTLPPGYVGNRAAEPAPVHGFVVRLPDTAGTLSVDGSYNTHEFASARDAAKDMVRSYAGPAANIEIVSTSLGRLPGVRYSAAYLRRRQVGVVALRKRGAAQHTAIVYSIILDVLEGDQAKYTDLLESVIRSFTLTEPGQHDP